MATVLLDLNKSEVKKLSIDDLNGDSLMTGFGAELTFNSFGDNNNNVKYEISDVIWHKEGWTSGDNSVLVGELYCVTFAMTEKEYYEVGDIISTLSDQANSELNSNGMYSYVAEEIDGAKFVLAVIQQLMDYSITYE